MCRRSLGRGGEKTKREAVNAAVARINVAWIQHGRPDALAEALI